MDERGRYTILVVDDNDDVRRLVRKVLESSGHKIVEASDGSSALGIVTSIVPDLVLMDIRLPGEIDGLETTRRMLDDPRLRLIPVVALTASVSEKDQQMAARAGCQGFIGKPLDIRNLPDMVVTYINRGADETAPGNM